MAFRKLVFLRIALLSVALGLPFSRLTLAAEVEPKRAELFRIRDGLGNVAAKLAAGKEVRIAYFGGSITAMNGWRNKSLKWFQDRYPQAMVEEIHGAIGGTGSDLGVFRYRQDVLAHRPDLVFVEFAVNDGGAPPETIYRAMEGIVRQTWHGDPAIDLCYVYTIHKGQLSSYERGLCPRSASVHEYVAGHYGIPSINMALRVSELAAAGKLVFPADPDNPTPETEGKLIFARDDCHPLDAGHELYRQVIAEAMAEILPASKPGPHELKAPLRADNWERARLVPLSAEMLHGSWQRLDPQHGLGKTFGRRLPEIWHGSRPGDAIEFRFRGTRVGLYDLVGPDGGQIRWTIDSKPGGPRPRFDHYCTYHRLASVQLAEGLEDRTHTARIEIDDRQPDRSSVTDRIRDNPGFDPRRFDGTNVWAGYIMLLGELAE